MMAKISESLVSLRFGGDDLNPTEISALLGVAPTRGASKGDIVRSERTGRERTEKTGIWILEASDRVPGNLDEQIEELLSPLPKDLSLWRSLEKYRPDLFVGLFMEESNEGLGISVRSLTALGERGIGLALDVYAPTVKMNNIQIVDGAENATFSVFQATDKEFNLIYQEVGQDMEIIEDFIARVGIDRANEVLNAIWERPILKRNAYGIRGTLYFDYESKRKYLPASKREKDINASSINSAQRRLFTETSW